ncbi:MAG: DUF6111 family protein [Alphaproteobacteria bacterium]|jgi:hypothetical protein|nr:DUF6111 family protein [Alphaproteobacteria bacterium]MDP6518033.1 DUF6111 family protein [Alphaproteobacteria bacterium]
MKIFLTRILPLLLPLIIYFGWLYWARRRALATGVPMPRIGDAPWAVLVAVGLGVLIVALIGLGLLSGEEPGGVYVPPHMEDGRIVPGHIER